MRKIFFFIFVLLSTTVLGQKFSIKGQVADTVKSPLPSATVLLLSAKDSSLVNFMLTDVNGFFELKNVAFAEYILKITSVGFKTSSHIIKPPTSGTILDLGLIAMEIARTQLDEVVVEAEKAPVVMKKDTIEFNAGSFKTKPNAMVEDLLKKLPGVEVDNDGTITAQGEQVRRVTVDGKNFFGSDPKLATKNLPADAVDKVQLFDKKSDQATFSGIEDGQREKTINLELKEEKRNGAFGNITGGVGTDERFQAKANVNRFKKGKQLSFLGMGNNINEQGFSMDDYMNFTGGSQQMMGGGAVRIEIGSDNQSGVPLNFGNRANGIMTNYAGGVNFNNEFNKNTELGGSYFYNYLDHNKLQSTYRENSYPAGRYIFNQNSRQNNTNDNHRLNMILEHKFDSANSIKFTSTFAYNHTNSEIANSSRNVTPDSVVQNESESLTRAQGDNKNLTANALLRHRFQKKGRTLSANLQLGFTQNDRNGTLDATNNYYTDQPRQEIIKQTNQQATDYQSYGASLSYTEPLGGRKYLEANYSIRQNKNQVNKQVYDVVNDKEEINNVLSNIYNSDYQYQRGGLNFRLNRKKYNITAGGSLQSTHLTGNLQLLNAKIDKSFQNVLPSAHFNYDFSMTKHLRFDYETSVQEPTIQQLQPVVDNSDPLNLYVGNPNLRPAYQQSWSGNFTTFDPAKFISFFGFIDVDYTTNAITNSQIVNQDLVRTTRPVNVSDNLSVNTDATFGFPIAKLKSRLSVTGSWRDQRSVNMLNGTPNRIKQQTSGANARYNYRFKDILDVSLSAQLSHQQTEYEFNQPNQTYFNKTYSAESNLTFLKSYQFNAYFDYLVYNSESTNFHQTIPLLNLALSRFLLKNKTGELKFSVNNVLDKALGINQTTSANYMERTTTNSLGRYFMVSFTYSLNKQLNPMGAHGSGGMMMRIER